jgi:hypothetical protein
MSLHGSIQRSRAFVAGLLVVGVILLGAGCKMPGGGRLLSEVERLSRPKSGGGTLPSDSKPVGDVFKRGEGGGGGPETITLVDEDGDGYIPVTMGDDGEGIVLDNPGTVTIDGNGQEIDLVGSNPKGEPLITVESGVKLILKNVTFKGLSEEEGGNTAPLIQVKAGGTLVMEDKAVITGNYNAQTNLGNLSVFGGGVNIAGTFTMNDGAIISGNYGMFGGGVHVVYGTFTMNGGTIEENTAWGSGGGVCVNEAVFIMEGGTISGNTVEAESAFLIPGGVGVSGGGGVYVLGTFKMNGGTISDNTVPPSPSFISGGGGGVLILSKCKVDDKDVPSTFTKTGGTITGNTVAGATQQVFVQSGDFNDDGMPINDKKHDTDLNDKLYYQYQYEEGRDPKDNIIVYKPDIPDNWDK